jgi:hypothetical protein
VASLWQKKTLIECIDNLPSPGALALIVEWILFSKKKTLIVDEMEEEKEGFDIMLLIIPAVLYMLFVAV